MPAGRKAGESLKPCLRENPLGRTRVPVPKPTRCAEAVKLSRLGHNREHTGCEVYPPSDVAGTQRNVRRHVRYRATDGELRQLPRSSSDGGTSARKDPFLTNGREINWITVPARAADVASKRTAQPSQATAHGSIEANRSEAERK
jgi:hypothetical protein